jgi:Flp pilus assembly protein TadB
VPAMPTPDDPQAALTSRERTILAGIEADLRSADPALARELSRGPTAPLDVGAFGQVLLISLGLLVAVTALVVVPPPWWPALVAVLAALVAPRLLVRALQRRRAQPER